MKRILPFCLLIVHLSDSPVRAQVVINEISSSNLSQYVDNHSDYGDWIELYNSDSSIVDLAGYYLSDDTLNNTKWPIPPGITIAGNGFLRFWASGRDEVSAGHYHTNFKLKQTKNTPEYVVLSNPSGAIVDSVRLTQKTQLGHSYGRTTNGANNWSIFKVPTFNASNNTGTPYLRYADKPDFDIPAGFYPSGITVSITSTDTGSVIRYTTDGTLPLATSTVYSGPLAISSTKVLKAIAINSDPAILPSYIEFASYFINVSHTLPVVSISGSQLTNLANGSGSLLPKGSLEYFDLNKLRKANTYGEFNKHGQDSWVLSQRSLDFISRDEMGYNHSIEEKLFNTSDRTNFQRIILRASGDDNYPADHDPDNAGSAHVRDAYIHNLALMGGLNLDVRRGTKIIVYLNGQYWGVYDFRENPDEHDFTDYYYGQDKFNLQYIETWGNTWAEYGGQQALDDWNNFYNYIMTLDLTVDSNWQYVDDRLEVKSLVDYVCVNMFTVCSDWLNWNTAWWRGLDSTGKHLKWGYILWDNDATFGHYINYTGIPDTSPDADPCDPEGLSGSSDPEGHIALLNKLRENPVFNQYYIARQLDLWNTVFSCEHMLAQLDSTVAVIDPEMTQHATRWNGTYSEWQTNVQALRDFISQRCTSIANGYTPCYNLSGPYNLVINADPADAGSVRLNSLVIDQFPWTGNYFGGMETILEAMPDSGNSFVSWTDNFHPFTPDSYSADAKVSLTTADTIVAHFQYPLKISDISPLNPGIRAWPAIFTDEINIIYDLPQDAYVSVKLFSVLGNAVAEADISETISQKGRYSTRLSLGGGNLAEGMYLLEFRANNYVRFVKLVHSQK